MFKNIGNIFKIAFLYMATIIGAGFASGQEILQFFSTFKKGGFHGILLAGLLFSLMGFVVLDRVYSERLKSYGEFIKPVFGRHMSIFINITVTMFMFCLYCIMLAGSGRVLTETFEMTPVVSGLVMCIISLVLILTSIKGIMFLSSMVTPILICGILFAGLYIITSSTALSFNMHGLFERATDNWFFSALLYVGYNSLMSVVVLSSLLPYLKNRRVGRVGGLLGGLLLCLIALVLNASIYLNIPLPAAFELPIPGILNMKSPVVASIYGILLWLAMLLSSVTSGYCLVDRLGSALKLDKMLLVPAATLAALPVSLFGFSGLISKIYPVFGYIGLFVMFVIIIPPLFGVLDRCISKAARIFKK